MADFTNRSPFVVTVARRPNLKRTFAYSRKDDAQKYINNLREQGLEPTVDQGDSSWLVRVRLNRPGFSRHLRASNLRPNRRCHDEQATLP